MIFNEKKISSYKVKKIVIQFQLIWRRGAFAFFAVCRKMILQMIKNALFVLLFFLVPTLQLLIFTQKFNNTYVPSSFSIK